VLVTPTCIKEVFPLIGINKMNEMPCQLSADCLYNIFEYLEGDKGNLHSCLLVNRLWCRVSVRILWRDAFNYNLTIGTECALYLTLMDCLPNESKDLLCINGVDSSLPLFNYASFCKVFLIGNEGFEWATSKEYAELVEQEMVKMFMNQTRLKKLIINRNVTYNIIFAQFSGVKDCLTNLSELICHSSNHSETFHQLSQICCNIQSLTITIIHTISNGLKDLISSQNNLKCLILQDHFKSDCAEIIPHLTKHSNTLIKLKIYGNEYYQNKPLSFVAKFTNLQELVLSFRYKYYFDELNHKLQYISFPQLQTLKFPYTYPKDDITIKFLENNGKNLKEFYVRELLDDDLNSLHLSIAKFRTNLFKTTY
jgi:hypothetical protein